MANDKENYKEGVDFEFRTVTGKDGKSLYKNRHFFTRAEKDAMKAPKATPKAAPKAPAKPNAPKAKPKANPYTYTKVGAKAAAGANAGTRKSTGAKVTGEQRMPVPGAAIGRAIRNAFAGKGETDAAKISSAGDTTLRFSAPRKPTKEFAAAAKSTSKAINDMRNKNMDEGSKRMLTIQDIAKWAKKPTAKAEDKVKPKLGRPRRPGQWDITQPYSNYAKGGAVKKKVKC